MRNVIDLITYWKDKNKDYEMGLSIYLDYGRNNRSIRSFLLKAKLKKRIPQKAQKRLENELDMIYRRYISSYIDTTEKSQQKEKIKEAAKEIVKTRKLADDELALMGSIRNPYSAVSDAELLIYDRRKLATKRALLTNQLDKDGGNQETIDQNILIIEQILPINDQIKFIEKRLKDLENKKEVTQEFESEPPKNEKVIILRVGAGKNFSQYTYADIMSMSLQQVKELRKRVRDAKSKAKTRSDPKNTHIKTEKSRLKHEKEYGIKLKEMELLNIIISHKETRN